MPNKHKAKIYLSIVTVQTFPSMGQKKPDSDVKVSFRLLVVQQFIKWNIPALSSYHHISTSTNTKNKNRNSFRYQKDLTL